MENRLVVDKNGTGDFFTIKDALNNALPGTCLFIKNGTYKEKLIIDKPNISFVGEDALNTKITYDDGAFQIDETGSQIGTFKTASVHILKEAEGFSAKNITFENSAGRGDIVGQAVAVYADCDKAVFLDCRFLGRQDTLLTAPMHEDITREPDILNRQYFENCYIEGDVDFIFGGATAIFNKCEIYSLNRDMEINGYITAACTSKNLNYGYVFIDCKLVGDAGKDSVYLGRPWREYAKTVFINCFMDKHIKKQGFSVWNDTDRHKTCYYAQYNSNGEGYKKNDIAEWTHILDSEEASMYTIENIFNGWNPQKED